MLAQIDAEIITSIMVLAIGSALNLALIEFIYVAKRVIELILIGWWILSPGFS